MLINEALIKITDEYLKESKGSTLNNPLHKFIRKEVPEIIIDIIVSKYVNIVIWIMGVI